MIPRAIRLGFSLLAGVLFSVSAWASLYINTPTGYQHMGGPAREGPFATRAQAEAFLRANFPTWPTSNIVGYEDAQPTKTQNQADNSAAERDAEEKAAAEKKAAREAEDARRFQKIHDDATRQLKGFNQATGQTLKGVGGGGVSGLKEAPKPTAVAVNTDAMVVDLRNLSSGLPKSVDDAIPNTPAGNRVRRGFQAIAKHDWDNALLWFQDAYNREPGDPGLQRLVDLAQFTIEAQARIKQQASGSNSANGQPAPPTVQVPAGAVPAAEQATPQEISYTRDNTIARIAARNMAAEARVKQVYAELHAKYGEKIPAGVRFSALTNDKISKARNGEGLPQEELDEQFEAAMTEFLKTHKTYSTGGVGGSATADEIVLGGKG